MKKKTTLSIDEDVLKEAIKRIPNLSGFFETCLKEFLGMTPGNYPTREAHDIIDNIGKNQVELHILNEQNKIEVNMKEIEQEKLDRYWRKLYVKYRDEIFLDEEIMKEASKILSIDCETLEDIMDSIQIEHTFFNTWQEAKDWYNKVIE